MEEKVLIQGNMGHFKKLKKISIALLVATLVFGILWFFLYDTYTNYSSEIYLLNYKYNHGQIDKSTKDKMVKTYQEKRAPYDIPKNISAALGIVSLAALAFYFDALVSSKKQNITVSDRRVFGICASGKAVDLPIDSLTAVGTSRGKGIKVAAASNKYRFFGMDNRDEVHKTITELLLSRQNEAKAKNAPAASSADELSKFKDLLDKGIITQEEFDAKKKQLLGL